MVVFIAERKRRSRVPRGDRDQTPRALRPASGRMHIRQERTGVAINRPTTADVIEEDVCATREQQEFLRQDAGLEIKRVAHNAHGELMQRRCREDTAAASVL
ncbi:MAG TPA: hypothetical protein VKB34_09405 [Povalibacter sp.]|nr:hypothetical protein [Povalibacter sp.]